MSPMTHHHMSRHHLIRQLLADAPVPSQDELRRQLAHEGVEVTQGTLSRDLKNLGVVKGPQGYTLSAEPALSPPPPAAPHESPLQATVRLHTLSVETAGNIVVVRTGPGHAQLVAVALDADRAKSIDGLVGTVAGDDTIFIAARSAKLADAAASKLRDWAGLTAPRRKKAS